ncbi:hypothetical protein [Streptomyces sp. CB01881]|uniref:hypothetical protein n=1 Tax=Streptomyces sp. CB01881 TaxID=2078691 RepID=UPI0011DF23AE|nr:hypothetical protein [Streptomyces sp. CB01881]TYC73635.1 hypothetical protein EH183_16355 [Streptomyces sp. CB01881]
MSDRSWYVLIERDRRDYGDSVYYRWQLAPPKEAPLGREQAVELAEETARTYLPRESGEPAGTPARRVFRLPDGGFLVQLHYRGWKRHFRVSVGELVHAEEEAPPPSPANPPRDAAPPRRGLFGRR